MAPHRQRFALKGVFEFVTMLIVRDAGDRSSASAYILAFNAPPIELAVYRNHPRRLLRFPRHDHQPARGARGR
jgi:hypothetical protein